MTHTPCVLAHPIPGRHLDACTDPECRGCLPAIATTGLLVCTYDERRARDGLRDAPGLYDDLGDPRTSTRPRTGSSGSDSGSPMLLSPERITARDNLRRFLVTWCMILEDDYALTMPADTVRAKQLHDEYTESPEYMALLRGALARFGFASRAVPRARLRRRARRPAPRACRTPGARRTTRPRRRRPR